MKSLPLLALLGYMLALGLSTPFKENEREEELNGIEDHPLPAKVKGEYDLHKEDEDWNDSFGYSDFDDDDVVVNFDDLKDETRITSRRSEEFSDPQRRIRIRPRTYRRVRRYVRQPLRARRLRKRPRY